MAVLVACAPLRASSRRLTRTFAAGTRNGSRLSRSQRAADRTVADKFNLETLNDGESPFNTTAARLLKPAGKHATPSRQARANASRGAPTPSSAYRPPIGEEMRDIYSLAYLTGATNKAGKETTRKNPFDITSRKLK